MQVPVPLTQAPAATAILVITLASSLAGFANRRWLEGAMLHPHVIVHERRVRSLLTYGFVHADLMHLLFNGYSYFSIAFILEQLLGTGGFLAVYLGSLILGTIPTIIRHRDDPGYRALGASGAVSGLFFSAMLFFPAGSVTIFPLPIPIPYPLFAVLFLAVSWYGARRNLGHIGHEVHLYGALAGLVLTILVEPAALAHFLRWMAG